MPTYAQLQAESWWGREIVTPEIDWLGDELCRRTKRPRTAFGSKGNNVHLRGAHRSQEWIKRSRYCTNRTYTVQAGLTGEQERHIAGVDFTPGVWGAAANRALMVAQTRRLVAALKAGRLPGVREVIGTLDGRTVVGTRPDGSTFSSDSSHLEHWHLTLDRRHCRDQQLMARIVATALDLEDDMANFTDTHAKTLDTLARVLPDLAAQVGYIDGRNEAYASGRTTVRKDLKGGGGPVWLVQAVMAIRDGIAQLDGKVAAKLADDFAAIEAAVAAADAADAERDQAAAGQLRELADLVRAGQSGQLAAEEVLRRMGEVLTAGTTGQG
ncbi:hypothetical protein AB0N38_33055 [Micromonospora aurantiaca]|uniref:hypothetical protein n=1 Tax=Micromonospora aurantiaca (nom. illeg.) TaxID=47850 RepID=UPI00341F37D5